MASRLRQFAHSTLERTDYQGAAKPRCDGSSAKLSSTPVVRVLDAHVQAAVLQRRLHGQRVQDRCAEKGSVASSKVRCGMGSAAGTRRGSEVMTPAHVAARLQDACRRPMVSAQHDRLAVGGVGTRSCVTVRLATLTAAWHCEKLKHLELQANTARSAPAAGQRTVDVLPDLHLRYMESRSDQRRCQIAAAPAQRCDRACARVARVASAAGGVR